MQTRNQSVEASWTQNKYKLYNMQKRKPKCWSKLALRMNDTIQIYDLHLSTEH